MKQWRQREDGVAILMALAVVMVVGILVVVIASTAIYETSASGRDRQRSTAVSTAEGAVDTMMATIQTSTVDNYPCPDPATPASTSVLGDQLAVAVTIEYFSPTGTPMNCLTQVRGGDPVGSAHISATAKAQQINGQQVAQRTVETQLNLLPHVTNLLANAIHSDTSVRFTNKVDVINGSDTPGDAANIYSRGNFECNNNGTYDGSIVAVGTVYLANPCVVKGSIWSGGKVTLDNGPTVQGSIRSASDIDLQKGTLGGTALARGWVHVSGSGHACDGSADKCLGGQQIDAPQPVEVPFPELAWPEIQSAWTAEGYVVEKTFSGATCGMPNASDAAANWINANLSADLATSAIVIVDCPGQPVTFGNNINNVVLGRDLLIISRAGFVMKNSVKFTSIGPDVDRNVYFIQPALWSAAPVTCNPTVGITLDNLVSFEVPVRVLLYSPCAIVKANQGRTAGQIYARGEFTWNNQSNITYDPVPVWGLDPSATSATTYDVEILYKRET
jgi:Tfp pilus assembly protein PilX